MDALQELKLLIDENEVLTDVAQKIGWSKQRLHYLINTGKTLRLDDYYLIRNALRDLGIEETKEEGLIKKATSLNLKAARLCDEVAACLADNKVDQFERASLLDAIRKFRSKLDELETGLKDE